MPRYLGFSPLTGYTGVKKIENYLGKIVQPQIDLRRTPGVTEEDLEALMIERNRRKEEIEGYGTVERILSQRDAEPSDKHPHGCLEYLCKWSGLYYEACTWEDHDSIKEDAADAIRAYLSRLRTRTLPAFSTPIRARPIFERIHQEPSYIKVGGSLKDFQVTGLNWLAWLWHHEENGILADEVRTVARPASCLLT